MKKKKQDAKRKRACEEEQVNKEKRICEAGLGKLQELELREYNNLCEKFKSKEGYQFQEFLDMIDHMWKPIIPEVEGHIVSLTHNDCTIMMETSAVQAITKLAVLGENKENVQGKTSQNKQQ